MPKILIKEILFFPLKLDSLMESYFIVKVADERIISFITHFKANEKLLKIQLIISLLICTAANQKPVALHHVTRTQTSFSASPFVYNTCSFRYK